MTEPPLMRAAHMQQNLAEVSALGLETAQRVFALVPPGIVQAIEAAPKLAWLPIEHDIAVTAALAQILGNDGCRAWSRAALRKSLDTPLLRPFLDGAARLFGVSPRALFRWVPQGWTSMFRHCGELSFEASAGDELWLAWARVPPVIVSAAPWVEGTAGALEAILDLCRVPGRVQLEPVAGRADDLRFHVSWTPR